MKKHVGPQSTPLLVLQRTSVVILHDILQLVVNALRESLLAEDLVQNGLPVIPLHLDVMLEGCGQFHGTPLCLSGTLEDGIQVGLQRPAEGTLLTGIPVHGLLHASNVLVERIHDTLDVTLTQVRKLLLARAQHVLRGRFHVRTQVHDTLLERLPHGLHSLTVTPFLSLQDFLMTLFLCPESLLVSLFLCPEGLPVTLFLSLHISLVLLLHLFGLSLRTYGEVLVLLFQSGYLGHERCLLHTGQKIAQGGTEKESDDDV